MSRHVAKWYSTVHDLPWQGSMLRLRMLGAETTREQCMLAPFRSCRTAIDWSNVSTFFSFLEIAYSCRQAFAFVSSGEENLCHLFSLLLEAKLVAVSARAMHHYIKPKASQLYENMGQVSIPYFSEVKTDHHETKLPMCRLLGYYCPERLNREPSA